MSAFSVGWGCESLAVDRGGGVGGTLVPGTVSRQTPPDLGRGDSGNLSPPLIGSLAPSWAQFAATPLLSSGTELGRKQPDTSSIPAMVILAGVHAARAASISEWIFFVWLTGFAAGFSILFAGFVRLWWTASRAETVLDSEWMLLSAELYERFQLRRPVRLLADKCQVMPVTWGFLRPRVLLPQESSQWDCERRRIVLAHEFAHIQRNDWAVQMAAELVRTVYWFNPLVWMGCNRLRQESEQACDDIVLTTGIHAPVYAEHLLALARTLKSPERAWSVALAMARRCHLERRFVSMLNPILDRRPASRTSAVLTSLLAACLTIPLSAFQTPVQNASGKFFGTVYDPSRAAVPNAVVIATNAQARTRDMTTSDAAGLFQFTSLPAGTYSLEVLKPGFRKFVSPVQLEPNQGQNKDVNLELGSITEQVNVVAAGQKHAAEPGEPKQIRVGGNVMAAKLIQRPVPPYPVAAKAAGIQGSVRLEAVIDKQGVPMSLRVSNGSIDPDLAKAAVEAVSQWRYQPTLLNGNPVEIVTIVDVNFTLLP